MRKKSPLRKSSAFTIIELLVAMAVLATVLTIVVSIINSTSKVTGLSTKQMSADKEARMVFDRIAGDLGGMVCRPDVDYVFDTVTGTVNGSGRAFFYSEVPAMSSSGAVSDNASMALVGYHINSQYQLERLGLRFLWNGNSSMPDMPYLRYPGAGSNVPDSATTILGAFGNQIAAAANYRVLGENVFRLTFCFLLKPYVQSSGAISPPYYSNLPYNNRVPNSGPGHDSIYGGVGLSDVQAIVVTIAILDADSRKVLPSGFDWGRVAAVFTDPLAGDLAAAVPKLPAETWQARVDAGIASASGLPAPAASQVRIYQRIFAISASTP